MYTMNIASAPLAFPLGSFEKQSGAASQRALCAVGGLKATSREGAALSADVRDSTPQTVSTQISSYACLLILTRPCKVVSPPMI